MDKELAQDPGSQLQSHINQIFYVALDLPWCLPILLLSFAE